MSKKEKLALHDLFKDESALGIRYFEDEDAEGPEHDPIENDKLEEPLDLIAYLPDDFGQMGICTNCARYIVSKLEAGRGEVYGFTVEDNHVESDEVQACFGHDFAVIDNRYIVDAWISVYSGTDKQIVFDMEDSNDAAKIKHYFGDPGKWAYLDEKKGFIRAVDENFPEDKRIKSTIHELDNSMSM